MMQHVARVRQRQLILVIFYCFMKILSPLIWYACDSVTLMQCHAAISHGHKALKQIGHCGGREVNANCR